MSPVLVPGAAPRGPGVVLGVVGHDIHAVANRIMELALAEVGYRPFNLGTGRVIEDFVDAVVETGARAVVVSSLNGEGEEACAEAGERFAEAGLEDVRRYAGGNLVVGDRDPHDVEKLFHSYGFHRVFYRPSGFEGLFDALRTDLGTGPGR
jgi:methylaspartate mutase sigma subunit